jgi:hypothetical protein
MAVGILWFRDWLVGQHATQGFREMEARRTLVFFDTGNKEQECGIKFYGEELLLFDDPLITPRLGKSAEFRYSRVAE